MGKKLFIDFFEASAVSEVSEFSEFCEGSEVDGRSVFESESESEFQLHTPRS